VSQKLLTLQKGVSGQVGSFDMGCTSAIQIVIIKKAVFILDCFLIWLHSIQFIAIL
jgi:hypothetical protein